MADLLKQMSWIKQTGLNVLFCTGIALFLTAIHAGGTLAENFIVSFTIGFSISLSVSLFIHLFRNGPPSLFVTGIVLGILLGSFTGVLAAFALIGQLAFISFGGIVWRQTMIMALTFGAVGSWLFYSLMRISQARALAKEAELKQATYDKLLAQAELKTLQAQIEPHFLYNTLANVHTLIGINPAQASTMLENLIGFLRRSLAQSRSPQVTLADEVAILRCYLDVQKVRMGERLRYTVALDDGLGTVPFPPMLLQPLVENAVKHGLEPEVGSGAIDVIATRGDGQIRILVADSGAGFPSDMVEGVGLANVRARLRSLYGNGARLALSAGANGGVTAEITIPEGT